MKTLVKNLSADENKNQAGLRFDLISRQKEFQERLVTDYKNLEKETIEDFEQRFGNKIKSTAKKSLKMWKDKSKEIQNSDHKLNHQKSSHSNTVE